MSRKNKQILFFFAIIITGITARVLPHAANFVPITALALLGAAYLSRRIALIVPLGIMIVSDMIIGMHPLVAYTWGSFVLIAYLGSKLYKRTRNRWHLAALGPVGSVVFFIITNFGVWLQGHMYEHTTAGLIRCFTLALPFLRGTLMSDTAYTPLVFIATYFALKTVRANRHVFKTSSDVV